MPKGIDHFKVKVSDQVKTAMEDPEIAEAIRDSMAQLRQALADIVSDDPAAVAAVMLKLGAVWVDSDDFPEDDHGDG